jgi:hypothetical protein
MTVKTLAEAPELSAAAENLSRYRDWVTDHRIAAASLAGLVGTHLATVIGFWLPSIRLPELDFNTFNGLLYLGAGSHASKAVLFWTGAAVHYTDGLIFALVFAVAVHPRLPWRSTVLGNLLKGLTMGMLLAVITCVWMVPRVWNVPNAGFFSHGLGWKFVLAIFLWHFVWGLHVGVFYNPRERHRQQPS